MWTRTRRASACGTLAAAGDYAGALSEYVRLEAELPVPPSRETRRLLEEIRRQAPPPLGTGGYP